MIPIRPLLIAILFFVPVLSFAQDTTYMDAQWQPCKEKTASYYRVMTKQTDGKYKVEDHFLGGQLQMSGTYLSDKIEDKTQRDGYFVAKDEHGYTTDEGSYTAGKQTGFWKFYYTNSTALKGTKEFHEDSTVYTIGYDSATGRKKYETTNKGPYCPIKNVWYYSNAGTVSQEHIYSGCRLTTVNQYYPDGKIKKQERYKDKTVEGNTYDTSGNEIAYNVEQQPEPSFDMGDYLSKYLRYPQKARDRNIQGKVLMKFIVNEDGRISDVSVVQAPDPDLAAEAERCIKGMPPWKPGTQNNIPVKVYFTQPMTFKLD